MTRKNSEFLSFQDIAWAWSEETGESAQALEGVFQGWFKEFLARNGYVVAGDTGDEPGILANLLERPIWRDTFETFCEERDLAKPRFWFPDEPEGQSLAQPAEVPVFEATTEERKSSGFIPTVILVIAFLLSWSLVLLPIWLLIRWLLMRG